MKPIKHTNAMLVSILLLFSLSGCDGISDSSGLEHDTYTVSYGGNGNTGGSVPIDDNGYQNGQMITVLGNTGSLVKSGTTFAGWNTSSDGIGSYRIPGSTFMMDSADVTLYAHWVANYTVNDTYFIGNDDTDGIGQWALEIMGIPALWGHFKDLEQTGTMREDVVIAVVDTGYTEHPDLLDNLLADDGYDFIEFNHDSGDGDDVRDDDATDMGDGTPPFEEHSWHGTGAIAAATNNGLGIAGIGLSRLKILPLRALGYTGGDTYDIAQSMRYAAGLQSDSSTVPSKTAKIINLSLGGGGSDAYFEEVLATVTSMGIIVVASAGNSREYGATEADYPASSDYTVAAAAITYTNTIAPYSNPGAMVDIAAPGGRGVLPDPWTDWVITLLPDPLKDQPLDQADYMYAGTVGTAISCPHIAGILAMLCTVDDRMDLTIAKEVLRRSATDLGDPGWDRDFGHGLVNALAAFGEYKLLLDAGWTGLSSRSAVIKTPLPDAPPTGELSENSLIVRFVADGEAKSVSAAGRLSAMGATPTGSSFGKDMVIKPDAGIDPAELRTMLLEEPDVETVFYNYKYWPK